MANDIPGLRQLDPPPGGLERLNSVIGRSRSSDQRWAPLLPWATTAGVALLAVLAAYHAEIRMARFIVEQTEAGEPMPSAPDRAGGEGNVRIYLLRPVRVEPAADGDPAS